MAGGKRKQQYEEKTVTKKMVAPPPGIYRFKRRQQFVRRPYTELKFHDFVSSTTLNVGLNQSSQLATQLNLVPQGTDRNQRIGREVVMKYLVVRATVQVDNTGSANDSRTRHQCVVFCDKEAGAISATAMSLLYKNSAGVIDYNIQRDMGQPSRMMELARRRSPVMFDSNDLAFPDRYTWEFTVPLKNMRARFSGSAVTPTDNLIYIGFICDQVQSAIVNPVYTISTRVVFEDK